jgi:hypothetical protein
MGLFRRKPSSEQPKPDELYESLRDHVLRTTPDDYPEEFREAPILALLMEMGFPQGVASLLGDIGGHVALYLSNGGGTMGNWTSPALTDANTRWFEIGVTVLPQLAVIANPPPPGAGMVQFVAVTPTGIRGGSFAENELQGGRHPLSLFYSAAGDVGQALDDLTTQARRG